MLEVHELLKGTLILGQEREEANNAMGSILIDGLIPAFGELRTIRGSEGKKLPVVERLQMYEDFARKLWKSYKDLTQRAAKEMGFEIGFLYQKEKEFEKGVKSFQNEWPATPPEFYEFLRETRREWQNELGRFRNKFLEHQEGDRNDFKQFYERA